MRLAPLLVVLAGCSSGTFVKLEFADVPSSAQSIDCALTLGSATATASFKTKPGESSPTGSLQIDSGSGVMSVTCNATNGTPGPEPLGTASGMVTIVRGKTETLSLSFGAVQPDGGNDASIDMATPDLNEHDLNEADLSHADMTELAPMLSMTPASHDYGTLTDGTTSMATMFMVTNNGDEATPALTIGIDNAAFIVTDGGTCQNATLATGASCQFSVAFKPTAPGLTAGHVSITYTGIIGTPPSSMVMGTGVTPGALAWNPTTWPFNDTLVGATSSTKTFTLSNTGGATTGTIAISLGGTDSGSFEISNDLCTGTTLAAAATCTVDVDFKPQSNGPLQATLQADATPGGTAVSMLSGNGLAPAALTLSPDTSTTPHDYGTVDIQSASGTFTLTVGNSGDVPTGALTYMLPTGVTAAAGSNCMSGNAIAAKSSCTLVLTYTPSAFGPASAAIPFTASPGGTATANLKITGRDYITVAVASMAAADGSIADGAGDINCSTTSTMCEYVYARTASLTVTLTATPATGHTFSSWTYMNTPPACANAMSAMCVLTFDATVPGSASSTPSATPFTYDANFM